MIRVSGFRFEDRKDFVRAICDVHGLGAPFHLRFDVHPENASAIDIDEPNWAAMALFYPAMLMGEDLCIEADISPRLLFNMRTDLMALVRNYEKSAKSIQIEAGATASPKYRAGKKEVATGLSCGVDSFATLLRYTAADTPSNVKMTAVTIFQVGALGPTSDKSIEMNAPRTRTKEVADRFGLKVYSLSSNMDDVYLPAAKFGPTGFAKTVGFRNASAALLLQGEIGQYFPSGNVNYAYASYGPASTTESIDAVLQPLLSTEALEFQCGCAGLSRFEKLEAIVDNPIVQDHIDVCVSPLSMRYMNGRKNCSRCWKCSQTMVGLEALGKLDDFSSAFDVDGFRRDRRTLVQVAVDSAYQRGPSSGAYNVIVTARSRGLLIPRPAKMKFFRRKLSGLVRMFKSVIGHGK